jgi:hypothetical protein
MWLMQSHALVGVNPHAADTLPTIDQDDLLIARQVPAGDEEGIESSKAGSDDADVALLHPRGHLR